MRVLVTGGCGFIGSHLVDAFVAKGHQVRVLDNLCHGYLENIAHHGNTVEFINGDLCDPEQVKRAVEACDWVSHQGALGSVPRSINDPFSSHMANATGTLNVLVAAKDAGVKRVIVASSSSVYGDTEVSPKHEGLPLRPKTPYAFTKVSTEEYARIFHSVYGLETIALRYFNVFGPRQNIKSAYAAVIPIFLDNLLAGKSPTIFGDGLTSRDFTYVANVVRGNMLAMEAPSTACGRVYNMGAGGQFTLNELYSSITEALGSDVRPTYAPKRAGDIDHSKADINLAKEHLGYEPVVAFKDGVWTTVEWFREAHLASVG